MLKKFLLFTGLFVATSSVSFSQFGIGLTLSNDLYNRYVNPEDGIASPGNGSFLLNVAVGPKIWVGGEYFSVSVETQANWGLFGLSLGEYKGLGSISFPFLAKANFGGLSGLNKEGRFGLSVGGGIQYNRTELYYLTNDFKEKGGERHFFRTYVVQAGYGFGISGFTIHGFLRYGFDPDIEGVENFHIGIQFDFNILQLRKISNPASEL